MGNNVGALIKAKGNNVWTIDSEETIFKALDLMALRDIGAVLVIEGDELVGIFTERDYARKGILHGKEARKTLVKELMTAHLITVDPTMTIDDCMKIMTEKGIRHLPVFEGGRVVGVLSIRDVVEEIILKQEKRISNLENYLKEKGFERDF